MPLRAGLGALIPIATTLVGLVAMFRGNRKPSEPTEADKEFDARQVAKADMERRMTAYLASRDSGAGHSVAPAQNNEENMR